MAERGNAAKSNSTVSVDDHFGAGQGFETGRVIAVREEMDALV